MSASSPAEKERRLRIEAEKKLAETQNELMAYKAKFKDLNALTGSLKTTNLEVISQTSKETPKMATLSRKASEIFSADPTTRKFKGFLRQLLVEGDIIAHSLMNSATVNDSEHLLNYLKQKFNESYNPVNTNSSKDYEREEELADLREEAGIVLSSTGEVKGFVDPVVTSKFGPTVRVRAQERFGNF